MTVSPKTQEEALVTQELNNEESVPMGQELLGVAAVDKAIVGEVETHRCLLWILTNLIFSLSRVNRAMEGGFLKTSKLVNKFYSARSWSRCRRIISNSSLSL
jgi:hypothetical protein